ncbi:hypothetical protein VIK251_00201 [Klebsiella phage vB_KpnM_VIK251]|nr:hypothetical protein VIK251_00201 [Klebsiella phage vB_KpnM_VIK251]
MTALLAILWFLWLFISVAAVFECVGWRSMVQFFPEGRRRWMLPLQLLTLFNFAVCILQNPFAG